MNILTMLANIALSNRCRCLSIMMKMKRKMSRDIAGRFCTEAEE